MTSHLQTTSFHAGVNETLREDAILSEITCFVPPFSPGITLQYLRIMSKSDDEEKADIPETQEDEDVDQSELKTKDEEKKFSPLPTGPVSASFFSTLSERTDVFGLHVDLFI